MHEDKSFLDWIAKSGSDLRITGRDDRALMEMIRSAKPERDREWAQMMAGLMPIPLWEGGAPGYIKAHGRDSAVYFMSATDDVPGIGSEEGGQREPSVSFYPNMRGGKPRGVVIVCAGGGFIYKSVWEAVPVAQKFYDYGFAACILDYRVQPFTVQDGLHDLQRAIRLLRYRAKEYNILPDKICCLGFSAGGILSSLAGTKFDCGDPAAADPIERESCRPDAVVQCYGAFSMAAVRGGGLGFSFEAQCGRAEYSPEKNIRSDCPPFFLWETGNDDPRLILNFGRELSDYGVPFELHIFPEGDHGCGLADGSDIHTPFFRSTSRWSGMACEFLENLRF
jgi:acetyl esterase/lipase